MRLEKMREKLRQKKGFTLIEMIIVIAIIAILIALIAPNMMKFLETANQTKTDAAAKTLYTSAQTFVTEKYVAGTTIPDGDYGKAGNTFKDMNTDYFNPDELAKITSYKITVSNGAVKSVELTMEGLTSYYPKKKTP